MAFWNRNKHREPEQITWQTPDGEYYNISNAALTAEHTLIAGATGCGKSTFLHSIIAAALVQHSPAAVRFIFIDPKAVELARYAKLPHTLTYTNTEAGALEALEQAQGIMEARYQVLMKAGKEEWTQEDGATVYVIIEELADLMSCPLRKQIQVAIQRLTQKGRAAGVHIIAATQAPSRKIIPAEITLNFTARFALACESAIESKQIIGIAGAEALPDHGEVIYKYRRNIGRYTVPFMKKSEVMELVNYWTSKACRIA